MVALRPGYPAPSWTVDDLPVQSFRVGPENRVSRRLDLRLAVLLIVASFGVAISQTIEIAHVLLSRVDIGRGASATHHILRACKALYISARIAAQKLPVCQQCSDSTVVFLDTEYDDSWSYATTGTLRSGATATSRSCMHSISLAGRAEPRSATRATAGRVSVTRIHRPAPDG